MLMKYIAASIAVLVVITLPANLWADKKKYVWAIEYDTMDRGEVELEHYYTATTPDWGKFTDNISIQHQVELEVGMTDRWDMRVYQIFEQQAGEDFRYSGFKLETRYRLGEKGKYAVDPLLYFEYKNKPDFSRHTFEFKLVLAKDIGKFNIAVNPILEFKEVKDGDFELEAGYAVGLSYEFSRLLSAGMEFSGGESGHYIGPVIVHGSRKAWIAVGSGFKIGSVDPGEPEFKLRTIMAVRF